MPWCHLSSAAGLGATIALGCQSHAQVGRTACLCIRDFLQVLLNAGAELVVLALGIATSPLRIRQLPCKLFRVLLQPQTHCTTSTVILVCRL